MTTAELQNIWPEWEIVRPLGEGAFGKVYEIRRDGDGFEERAALKVIRIPQSESEVMYLRSEGADDDSVSAHYKELAGQLSNEIATQAKLKGNSNIVSYEDRKIVPDEDGMGYTILIRMELLTSLLQHMAKKPLGHDDVLQLGLDMTRALLLCEKHHIVHRDIKPQNIFISPNGDYKLGDFGVARELEKTTNNMSRKGTYSYMAPEVFHGQAGSAAVDIYSLGIVLYTLLNGNRAPFLPPPPAPLPSVHEREAAQHRRLSGEALPPLPGVPAALNELVLKMCAFEPKERFRNARALAEAMEGVAYEMRADKTVSLFSWIGSNTPSVVPPSNELTEDEGSRWIDGTPVRVEPVPELKPDPETPEPVPAPKKSHDKALVAVLVGVVVMLAGVVAWLAMRGKQEAVNAGEPTSSEPSGTDYLLDLDYENAILQFDQAIEIAPHTTTRLPTTEAATVPLTTTSFKSTITNAPTSPPIERDPTLMNKEQLVQYYNDAVNYVRNAKPGYTRTELQKINGLQISMVGGMVDGLLNSIIRDKMPGDPIVTYKSKGQSNAGDFLNRQDISFIRTGDVASITAKKEGDNYVITITLGSEINPAKDGHSQYSRLFSIATRQDILNELSDSVISCDLNNVTLKYHSGKSVITVDRDGKIIKAHTRFLVDADAKPVKLSIFTFDLTVNQETMNDYTNFSY